MNDSLFIEIQRLCQLVHERGLRELAITRPNFSVSLTSAQIPTGVPIPQQVPSAGTTILTGNIPMPAAPSAPTGYSIVSPLIGIFYRSSSPDSPPFVDIGDTVEIGQTIGIVEAMKVFNEITAERAGTVIAISAVNGTLVQVDQPLVVIEPA